MRDRDRWSKQAEETQRLQEKKEEAWQLFLRQPSWGPKRREDFEREYKQKVTAGPLYSPFGSNKREEKSLQEWVRQVARDSSGRRKPERGRAWGRRIPTPKDVEHWRRYGIRESSPCHRSLQQESESRRQTGRRARRTGLLSGDNLVPEFTLVGAPTSTHRVHRGEPRDVTFRFARRREDALRNRETRQ